MLRVVFRPMKSLTAPWKTCPFLLFPRPFAFLFSLSAVWPESPLGAPRENHLWGHCQAVRAVLNLGWNRQSQAGEFLLGCKKIMAWGVSFKHLSSLRNGPRQPRKLQPRSKFNSPEMTTGILSMLNEAIVFFISRICVKLLRFISS